MKEVDPHVEEKRRQRAVVEIQVEASLHTLRHRPCSQLEPLAEYPLRDLRYRVRPRGSIQNLRNPERLSGRQKRGLVK